MSEDARYILIVDDDEDIREIVGLALEASGWAVRRAGDGIEALEQIRRHGAPALIYLDVMMPRLDGIAFARQVQRAEALAAVPIVLMSGDVGAQQVARELGTARCLLKPVELDALLEPAARFASSARAQAGAPSGAGMHP